MAEQIKKCARETTSYTPNEYKTIFPYIVWGNPTKVKEDLMMKFKVDFLKDELDLPYSAIESKIIDNNRWSVIYEIIFEYNGKFYQTSYSTGATEMQDESPWEYESEIECDEVEKKLVEIEKWVPVNEEDL